MNMLNRLAYVPSEPPVAAEPTKPSEAPKPKKCQYEGCPKKLMLSDFPCKCKGYYCSNHKFSELHKCSFDYKGAGKDLLNKQMPEVKASKLDKI